RFRPPKLRGGNDYEQDYEHGSAVKAVVDQFAVGALGLHHCRKLSAEDPIEEVSGTFGMTGAANSTLVLRRERGRHDATLFSVGRDIEEKQTALAWDPSLALWSILGEADDYRMSRERANVIEILKKQPGMTPSELAPLVERSASACKKLLWT